MAALTDERIAELEGKGFNRWQKYGKDRLYINAKSYGLECTYYKTGNIHTAYFNGESISNSDGYRLKSTKAFIDVATGELNIQTSFYDVDSIREAINSLL